MRRRGNRHRVATLFVPLRRCRRFFSRPEFAAMSRTAPSIDLDRFRADQDATADTYSDR
ncbi:prevent-host-death protein [Streptomyces albogriseolus]